MLLLSLDYSTASTGYAIFDNSKGGRLLKYGLIVSKVKKEKNSLRNSLFKLRNMAEQIEQLVQSIDPDQIVIEEVNRGIGRLSQKTLCGGHFLLLSQLEKYLDRIEFCDSDGSKGWRTKLGLRMAPEDSIKNKQAKQLNKRLPRGKKLPVVNKKHLACRYVNSRFGLNFDVDLNKGDSDIVDSIGLGISYLEFFRGK